MALPGVKQALPFVPSFGILSLAALSEGQYVSYDTTRESTSDEPRLYTVVQR